MTLDEVAERQLENEARLDSIDATIARIVEQLAVMSEMVEVLGGYGNGTIEAF